METAPVTWTEMQYGSKADYERLNEIYEDHGRSHLADNLVTLLGRLAGPKLGYQIDRYQHSLQSATRAMRAGERADLVVAALFHDIGDVIAPENHSDVAAAILAPYIDDEAHWIVKHHGIFQGYYYFHHLGGDRDARDRYRDSPYYDACVAFCAAYDQNCFDPSYDTLPIEAFDAVVTEVLSRPSRIPGVAPAPTS